MNTTLPYIINPNTTGAAPALAPSGTMYYSATASNFTVMNNVGANIPLVTSIANGVPSLQVHGTADFEGDITLKGKSLSVTLADIQKKLMILTPDPKKLEKWQALQKAYDRYKILETLLYEDDDGK